MDTAAWNHQPSLEDLRACGLYKFWTIPGMRAQVDFLQWLVDKWSIQDQCFFIGEHRLEIELEHIYFLTGLPKRGKYLTLYGTRPGGQSVDSLQLEYCNTQAKDKGIDIKTISCPELMVIAFTFTILCGAVALHVATGSQMRMAFDCFQGTIFNWCNAVLANVEGQLTRAKSRRLKTFGYGALVMIFGLERVPMLIPQHLTVRVGRPREPKLMRWVAVMARHPDERTKVARFKPEHFQWLENQVFVIQDFPYAGIDFRGDPDMVLPPGEQWDESGKILFNFSYFKFFYFFIVSKLIVKISNADVGPQRPAALQPFERRQPVAPAPAP